jgi:hypothetical protein
VRCNLKLKIHIRDVFEIDIPDSICIDPRKRGKWRLSYSRDEVVLMNDAIRQRLAELSRIGNVPAKEGAHIDILYHQSFAGREHPNMEKNCS